MYKINYYLIGAILFSLISMAPVSSESQDKPIIEGQRAEDDRDFYTKLEWQEERFTRIEKHIDELIDALKLEPDMNVLDIGTGSGLYAFKFAERLGENGKVFATDINSHAIDYVTQEIETRDLKNVYPVLVKQEGVDPFYKKQKYDIILVFHTFIFIPDQISYFKEMGAFLKEGGRVVVMSPYLLRDPLTSSDVADFRRLVKELLLEPEESPFNNSLSSTTRELIKQETNSELSATLKQAILNDFEEMRRSLKIIKYYSGDKGFKGEVIFTPDEQEYANEKLKILKKNVFEKSFEELTNKEKRTVMSLNKMLIVQKFREYLHNGNTFFQPSDINDREYRVKNLMGQAGYTLEEEYSFIPFEVVLVFSKK